MEKLYNMMAQDDAEDSKELSQTEVVFEDMTEVLAQTAADDEDMLPKVADFLSQLNMSDIDNMEFYLIQMEHATENGDQDELAQLENNLDSNMQAVADYLVQLDEQELAQITDIIHGN